MCIQPTILPGEDGFFMPRAVIFVNGEIPNYEQVRPLLQPGDVLIAADGGTRHILALGLVPSLVIGDLDSLNAADRRKLEAAGAEIRPHARDKNETDFELALGHAVDSGFDEILIIGALGRRLDQTLGNLALLACPSLVGMNIRMDDGAEQVFFVNMKAQVEGQPGDVVSLIPWGRKVSGVTTKGLQWPLKNETLHPNKTRGISNTMMGEKALVSVRSGLLLIVHSRRGRS
jgi:thiamine pyrophosphokinase